MINVSRVVCNTGQLLQKAKFLPSIIQMSDYHRLASRYDGLTKNIWVEINKIVAKEQPLNLGQGFPDFCPPESVQEALRTACVGDVWKLMQYTRSFGHPRLIQVLSKLYSPIFKREIDPMTEILVTIGAYGALFDTFNSLLNPGDEVIIIEPFFDCYEPMTRAVNAKPVFVPLRPTRSDGNLTSSDWKLDPEEFKSKFNERTKLLVLNTPHNPVGKVFSRDELQMISDLAIKHDVIVISDEVYEWITYPGEEHVKIATLPGMWERTVTIGSAGKTLSVTGWKLGWAIGPEHLIKCLSTVHMNSVYTCPTPIQEAVASSLEKELSKWGSPECYLQSFAMELLPKRDRMAKALASVGMKPIIPEGGYFMMADISDLDMSAVDDGSDYPLDEKFNRWMIKNKKVAAIHPSVFYGKEHRNLGEKYLRFCFCKHDETLDKASEIFGKWKEELNP